MAVVNEVVGGSGRGYTPSIDRCRINVIACVSAAIIFGCVASICLWKGGVSSLANRKLCYIGFASSGVALAFAVAALILGCRRASKESQKAAAPLLSAAKASEQTSPEAAHKGSTPLPAAQPGAPMSPVGEAVAPMSPAGQAVAPMPRRGQSPTGASSFAENAPINLASSDAELEEQFSRGFEFSRRIEDRPREESEKSMARYIARCHTNDASKVPIDMLGDIPLDKVFIGYYLVGCSRINLTKLPQNVREAFVDCIIENRADLANLIVDPKWINKTSPAFIGSYLQNNKNNQYLLASLNEAVRTQFLEYITKQEPSYCYMVDLAYLKEGDLTDAFIAKYVSIEGFCLFDRAENPEERRIKVRLANFIVQHKTDCINCIGDSSLITVVPSNQVIETYLNHLRSRQIPLCFERMQDDVRRAFISFIHEKKLWNQVFSSFNMASTYQSVVTDLSWISHLPDDEVSRGLREKLNASKPQ